MAQNYNLPDDWRERLATTKKAAVTPDDKLKLLDQVRNHVGSLLGAGTNRTIFNAIERDIRAQKDSAPARTGAPSNPNQSTEGGSSIPEKVMERKIETADGTIHISLNIRRDDPALNIITLTIRVPNASEPYTPDEASAIRDALTELVDDVRQDTIDRVWSKSLRADQV